MPCKYLTNRAFMQMEAVWTGLEPATSAVTGRHSNQLNYQTVCRDRKRNVFRFGAAKVKQQSAAPQAASRFFSVMGRLLGL